MGETTPRTARRLLISLPAIVLALAAFAPAARAYQSSDDAPDKPSPLIAVSDFNRDGIPDIAQVTLAAENSTAPAVLTVSLGRGDGTFRRVAPHPLPGSTPQSIVAGDFNGDGIPDLITGDDDGTLTLFLGDGKGNLASGTEIAHLDSVVSIAVADFNHDGIPDLAVSDWKASSVTVLLGGGKGAFQRASSFPLRMPGAVAHVTTADFNGDGIPDLAVIYEDEDGDTYEVMLGNGNGTFTDAPILSSVKDPNSHCAT